MTGPPPGNPQSVQVSYETLINLVRDVATIKERSERIPKIEEAVEGYARGSVPMREHELLMKRVDKLWGVYVVVRAVGYLLAIVNVILIGYTSLHAAGKVP